MPIAFPEPTCLLVTVLVLIKRYVGSRNEISMKGRAKVCVWKTHLSHFYVLQTTIKFGEVNVFPWSIFYGKQTFPGNASLRVCSENACMTANLTEHRRPCRILWLFMLVVFNTGNILQNNSKEHWEVKIIHIAAEET